MKARRPGVTTWLIQLSEITKTTVMLHPLKKRRANQIDTIGKSGKSAKKTAAITRLATRMWRAGASVIRRGTSGAITRVDRAAAAPLRPTSTPEPVMYSSRREISGMDRPNTIPHTPAQQMAAIRERTLARRRSVSSAAAVMPQL